MDYSKAIELYREWNEKINVISRKDIDNIYSHHILHSLAIAEYLRIHYPEVKTGTVLDVLAGPEEGEGYTWWQVRDAQGSTGWVVAEFVEPAE